MATLYIIEHSGNLRRTPNGQYAQATADNGTPQTPLAIGASSAQSAAFGTNTHLLEVLADANCFVALGSNPTADNTGYPLSAEIAKSFWVTPGDKLAVITR